MHMCNCGSNIIAEQCCQRFIQGQQSAPTPEALMRSRYVAYSQANIDYIIKTMRGAALEGFNANEARQWAQQADWQQLKVLKTWQSSDALGFVEFIACYTINQQPRILYEQSEFHRIDGCWFYITGNTPKVNRNAACPCGSQKKSKRCCFAGA